MSVQVGSAHYRRLVARAKHDIASERDARFDLGDCALEIAPVGDRGANTGVLDVLARFADDIGIDFDTLRAYRTVAAAWPDGTRGASVSWSVYRELGNAPDRFDIIRDGLTVDATRRMRGKRPQPRLGNAGDIEHMVREGLADPLIAESVMSDDRTAGRVFDAASRVSGRSPEQTSKRDAEDSVTARSDALLAEEELRGACARFSLTVRSAVERMDIRPGESRDDLLDALRRVQVHAEWALSVVQGGRTNLDEEIRRLIEGGAK